ncbi:MAG: ATP-grasp domain-containing protein [Candidatus Paracaedibacteraceae bacterium]|nr:ATP-grasp domain-containing protein [Candidatus Paracaedibacteraceae bacterium]
MTKINRILIANRGEIACRIIRTCKKLAIETIAVYSEADKELPFVKMATKAVNLGTSEAKESYLNIEKIIKICQAEQVDAVHPGYGFLSENADFADALAKAGIIFIGPSSAAIRAMGSKSEAKVIAEKVGVPTIKGYMGSDQSEDFLLAKAKEIGFPILIKATHGGGGKGMRRVDEGGEFAPALASCQREAQGAFGNAAVMLEKYIIDPRHIELQIFGDQQGTILTLSERDCSLQRRHQKVLEEAPAIGLSDETRAGLHRDAMAIAKAVNYVGAGTVEFLVDAPGSYYFLEMNTRLQVEHPVTEMVLGLDLVEWQIRTAEGKPLPLKQEQLHPQGHAIEVRIYAEDPAQGFLPSTGKIITLSLPPSDEVRFDNGYAVGNQVSIFYDPMLAKLIVYGDNRKVAMQTLVQALIDLKIKGVKTNREFLIELLQNPDICDLLPNIAYLDQKMTELLAVAEPDIIVKELLAKELIKSRPIRGSSPWDIPDDWRHMNHGHRQVRFECEGQIVEMMTTLEELPHKAMTVDNEPGSVSLSYNGKIYRATTYNADHYLDESDTPDQKLNAPMPGRVISVVTQAGNKVSAGTPLLILEAMKMEHTIRAPFDGIVETVFYNTGDFVNEGAELARVIAA